MKRALLLLGVFVALGASLASPAMAADAAPAATHRLQALDQQVLAALNRTRADHGLRPLVMSNELQGAAVAHSQAMLAQGFFAHDPPNGSPFASRVRGFYRSAGYDSWAVGENLIYSTDELTAGTAIAAWMASPAHRKNMLTPGWREVGIGSLHASSAGGLFAGEPTWVITMDFGARSGNVVNHKVQPKSAGKKATTSAKAKPNKLTRSTTAKPPKKQSSKPKPIDRVLPRPTQDPRDESGDPADTTDDPAAGPEDDDGRDDVAVPADEVDAGDDDGLFKP